MNWREKNDDSCDVDLGLSLSLQLKCPSKKSYMSSLKGIAFPSSSASRPKSVRGLDMNTLAAVADTVPPPLSAVSSSPDSTITSANGKRSERKETWSKRYSASSEVGGGDDASARKKLRLSKEQTAVLEQRFGRQCTLNQNQKVALAKQLNLQTRQVEVWFQNRRARTKSKKTEVDCAYLKRRCEDLMDENRRLEKEVAELKALKHSPQMKPPTTLAMCSRCERVSNVPKLSPTTSSTPSAATEMPTASNWLINQLQETRRPRP